MAGTSKPESTDSKLSRAGTDTGQAKPLEGEAASAWTKDGSIDVKLAQLKNVTVDTLAFESKPPELVDVQQSGQDLPWTTGWETQPHKETQVVQEFSASMNVSEILFPKQADGKDGGSRKVHRDKDGNVDQINEPDGSVYIKENGKWKHVTKTGEVEDVDSVTSKGDGTVKVSRPDGTTREEYPDGHNVEHDKQGRVTEVDYLNKDSKDLPPQGHGDGKRHFHYGPDGKIDEYTAPNGSQWKKDGDHWQKVDKNGQPVVDRNDPENKHNIMYGDMSVGEDGTFTVKNHHMKGEEPHTTRVGADGWRDHPLEGVEAGTHGSNERGDQLVSGSHKSPPSEGFLEKMNDEIANLPPNVQEYMKKHHIHVKVVNNIETESPEIANQIARGHEDKGEMYKNLDGYYDPKTNTVIVAEQHRDRRSGQWISDNVRVQAVIIHELGHAIDYNYPGGKFTQSAEFKRAYEEDLKNITDPIDRKRLDYLIQKGAAGGEEAFGDLFALELFGRPASSSTQGMIDLMKTKFAHTLALIRARVEQLH